MTAVSPLYDNEGALYDMHGFSKFLPGTVIPLIFKSVLSFPDRKDDLPAGNMLCSSSSTSPNMSRCSHLQCFHFRYFCTAYFTRSRRAFFGTAPICFPAISPFLNAINVGMLITPNLCASPISSSILILQTLIPASSPRSPPQLVPSSCTVRTSLHKNQPGPADQPALLPAQNLLLSTLLLPCLYPPLKFIFIVMSLFITFLSFFSDKSPFVI